MNCGNCGAQVLSDAEFCHKCGASLSGGIKSHSTKYETCEIEPKHVGGFLFSDKYKFVATAIGPSGLYTIAESPAVGGGASDSQLESIVGALVRQLTESGWEPTGRGHGKGKFNYTFRRSIEEAQR
jgi:hypothetical protein